jgi:hypothetical protein
MPRYQSVFRPGNEAIGAKEVRGKGEISPFRAGTDHPKRRERGDETVKNRRLRKGSKSSKGLKGLKSLKGLQTVWGRFFSGQE